MQRIYLPYTNFSKSLVIDEKQIHHQITRVLRARIGDEFIFFNGEDLRDFCYTITHITKTQLHFLRKNAQEKNSEICPQLTLYQALPNKFEKIELIVQKCCEIGYKKIFFFQSDRSQKIHISENKKLRIQKIAIEASEQCGGSRIPEIEFTAAPFSFERERIQERVVLGELFLLCHTESDNSRRLKEISFQKDQHISIFVGPEGGFSSREGDLFQKNNFQSINFGPRILRCETVGAAAGFYISQSCDT